MTKEDHQWRIIQWQRLTPLKLLQYDHTKKAKVSYSSVGTQIQDYLFLINMEQERVSGMG